MAPLLISADPDAAAPHEVAPFGPAATVLAYRDNAHATDLVARGRGSLAASLVSDDLAWMTAYFRDAAAWHGRPHLLDSTNMMQTTGHGSPLPALRHGGPARAGAGSEMAGTRGPLPRSGRGHQFSPPYASSRRPAYLLLAPARGDLSADTPRVLGQCGRARSARASWTQQRAWSPRTTMRSAGRMVSSSSAGVSTLVAAVGSTAKHPPPRPPSGASCVKPPSSTPTPATHLAA